MSSAATSQKPHSWTNLPKGWWGLLVIVLLLLVSAVVSNSSMARLAASQELEEKSAAARWSLVRVESLLVDAETGQRGYIITGDENYLTIAESAFAKTPVELERLRKLLPAAPDSQNAFEKLSKLAASKIEIIKRSIETRRNNGFAQAAQRVARGRGKQIMDNIREQVLAIDSQEVSRLREQRTQTQSAAARAQVIVMGANLLACVTALFSANQSRRAFRQTARAKAIVDQANAELELNVERRTAELRNALARLKDENGQRMKLEAELLYVSEREQRRMAEDLHDGQGQLLAAALHLINAHAQRLARAGLAEAREAENIKQIIREALDQTRSIARGLYPVKDTLNGLEAALQDLAARTQKMLNIECHFQRAGTVRIDDHNVGSNLFRIAQEAVNNAIRHGEATQVAITLSSDRHFVELQVRDNGRGLGAGVKNGSGLGLRMMQYRAQMLGATLQIDPLAERGVRILCRAPIAPVEERLAA
jgi:signal transduction histidine kinase